MTAKRGQTLPPSLAPRGLSRVQAAEYIGVSTTKFDELVSDGRMPGPKHIDGRRVWDRFRLDEAFSDLPGDDEGNTWDRLCGFDQGVERVRQFAEKEKKAAEARILSRIQRAKELEGKKDARDKAARDKAASLTKDKG